MIDNETLFQIFQNAVGIIPTSSDGTDEHSVFLGVVENITDAPAGVNAVMLYWTRLIDDVLQPDINNIQKLELITLRGFTVIEYAVLFDSTIKDFSRYPIYKSLLITTANERANVIYQLSKDSYDDYLKLLSRTLRTYNPLLYNFLYETYNTRTN